LPKKFSLRDQIRGKGKAAVENCYSFPIFAFVIVSRALDDKKHGKPEPTGKIAC
jgi:hypothetical protein